MSPEVCNAGIAIVKRESAKGIFFVPILKTKIAVGMRSVSGMGKGSQRERKREERRREGVA